MQDVVLSLSRAYKQNRRPLLLIGKGPSSDKIVSVDLRNFICISLNHACKFISNVPDSFAHFADIEALNECEEHLTDNNYLVLPWYPHSNMAPTRLCLRDYAISNPIIKRFTENNRLLSYNSSLANKLRSATGLPKIRVRYFSAVAALNIAALVVGATEIYTIGVDGGKCYGKEFSNLRPLQNGQKSFDIQQKEFERTCRVHGCRVVPVCTETEVEG